MPYVTNGAILQAKQMDLLTYLQNYEPHELVHISGNVYCTKTHDSLKISNGKWCWFSRGIGGKTALDYLIKVKGFSFPDAVIQIDGQAAEKSPVFASVKEKKPKMLLLPHANRYADVIIRYLENRGIDSDILRFCIETGRLYESSPNHNAVFVGFDKDKTAKYAAIRGVGKQYKGEATGSDKHFSFSINAERESSTVHLFESAIDLLSFATIQKNGGTDWQQDNLLSLAGVYQPKTVIVESKVPVALIQYFEDYPHIKKVVFHLDNDLAGRLATKAITAVLPKHYETADEPSPIGKDYNDFLCKLKGLPQVTKIERRYSEWENTR
jgi:hypothetical protein